MHKSTWEQETLYKYAHRGRTVNSTKLVIHLSQKYMLYSGAITLNI